MRYHSTRGGDKNLNFKDVLFLGYARDGGMFLPESVTSLSRERLQQWAHLSYQELAFQVLSQFLGEEDIHSKDLKDILYTSFSTFDVPEIVPVTKLKDGLVIVEMYHGRSLSFKDLAMSCLGNFFNYFLAKENKHINLLVCTSGDTGSSAIEAMKGKSNIDIFIILPKGRITPLQERQMTTVMEDNVHVFRVDGSSDDGDVIVKALFADSDFVSSYNIGSASSLNFCRIMVQLVHFFYAYLKICPRADQEMEFILPTGGCGNVAAGSIARKMGLPVRFVCAVNHNNALSRFFEGGQCDIGEVEQTIAPAIDIQFPYNIERVWFMCSDENAEEIKRIMAGVETNKIAVPAKTLNNLHKYVRVYKVSGDEEVEATLRRCWRENSYNLCPHTAVGVAAYYSVIDGQTDQTGIQRAVLATASPLKFPEAAKSAGIPVPTSEGMEKLLTAPTRYLDLEKDEDWVGVVRSKIVDISNKRK